MVKEKLAQFFACADAWHARTVQARSFFLFFVLRFRVRV